MTIPVTTSVPGHDSSLVRHDIVHEAVCVPEQAAPDGDLGAELPVGCTDRW